MVVRRFTAGALLVCAMTAAMSVPLTTPAAAQDLSPAGDVGVMYDCGDYGQNKHVTRAETLARSLTWVQVNVPYSQSDCYQNQYGSFRTDCSGYLSMIWGLYHSYTTASLDDVSHPIPRSELRTGDALLKQASGGEDGHTALFVEWADGAKTKPTVREQASSTGTIERTWTQSYAADYTPIRYDNIVEAAPDHSTDGSDINGDRRADLLGVKADGTLWYYPNTGTADGTPYSSGTQIGHGFGVFDWIDGADLSGDGSADLVARKPDGTLWYYPNNRGSNPGGVPFISGIQIGHGFSAFTQLDAADLDGDRDADLLGVKADGTLWYYPNTGTADGTPYSSGTQIGHGFGVFDWIDGADLSGDGRADLVARKPDGTLWYYLNTGTADGTPYSSGTQIGHGFSNFDLLNGADISGDGSADMFARKPDGTLWYYPNNRGSNPDGVPFISGTQIGHGFQNFTKLT